MLRRPSFTEGFRRDPMAHEGVFERIASFDLILSPRGHDSLRNEIGFVLLCKVSLLSNIF